MYAKIAFSQIRLSLDKERRGNEGSRSREIQKEREREKRASIKK